jgi:AraC-like DNA-binding protein
VLGREHGLDLVEQFRALSRVRIMLLTGHGSEELAIRAFRAGADDYLRKPVNLKELRATLSKLVQEHGQRLDPVEQARRILIEHAERPHTTASLAREVGLSEGHLRRQFRAAYGKTPRRYLTEVRMERASELLRTTSRGIEQVAHAVGYPSVAVFNRIFKRAFGVTPSKARALPAPPARPQKRGRFSRKPS